MDKNVLTGGTEQPTPSRVFQYNQTLNKTFICDQNVKMNFHELKTH